jgi:asparagine synthetase B (glutamine-hydrolysing)
MNPQTLLPAWYARLDLNALSGHETRPDGESLRFGPLAIFRAAQGCQTAAFGEANDSVALFDGYLFDRARLARELDAAGFAPTEAQLVARAYERWGAEMFERLEGGYLLAVWDARERLLLAGHDHLGRHPFYYAQQPGALWFASNVLALAHSGAVTRAPNRKALALKFVNFWPPAGETFFRDINRLPPGRYLQVNAAATLRETRYGQLALDDDEPFLPEKEAQERFEPMLTRAVVRCLEAGTDGVLLSGGLDSVTLAALAAPHCQTPLTACSGKLPAGYPPSHEDEMQDLVAQRLNLPHLVFRPDEVAYERETLNLALDFTPHLSAPSDVWWLGIYVAFWRKIAARGLASVLTGSGGDEWLGVHRSHVTDLLRRLRLRQILRFARAERYADVSYLRSSRNLLWNYGARVFLAGWWQKLAPAHKAAYTQRKVQREFPAWLCPDPQLRREVMEDIRSRPAPTLDDQGRFPRRHYLHNLRSFTRNSLMTHEFETSYHISHTVGLRLLAPYHDATLTNFMFRLAPETLLAANRYKGLLRPLAQKHLPGLGLERQVKSYPPGENPVTAALRLQLPALWQRVGCQRLGRFGVVNPALLETAPPSDANLPLAQRAIAFTVINAEHWAAAHLD